MAKVMEFADQRDLTWTYTSFDGCHEAECAVDVDAPPPYSREVANIWPTHNCAILDRVLLDKDTHYRVAPDMMIPNSTYRFVITRNKIKNQDKTSSDENNNKLQVESSTTNDHTPKATPVAKPAMLPMIPTPNLVKEMNTRKKELEEPLRTAQKCDENIMERTVQCERCKFVDRGAGVLSETVPSSPVKNKQSTPRQVQVPSKHRQVAATPLRKTTLQTTAPPKFPQRLVTLLGEPNGDFYFDEDDKRLLHLTRTPTPSKIMKSLEENNVLNKECFDQFAVVKKVRLLRKQLPAIKVPPIIKSKEPAPISHRSIDLYYSEEDKPEKNWKAKQNRVPSGDSSNLTSRSEPQSESSKFSHLEPIVSSMVDVRKLSTGPSAGSVSTESLTTSSDENGYDTPVIGVTISLSAVKEDGDEELIIRGNRNMAAERAQKVWESTAKDFRYWNSARISDSAKEKVLASNPYLKDEVKGLENKIIYHKSPKQSRMIPFDDYLRMRLLKMAKNERQGRQILSGLTSFCVSGGYSNPEFNMASSSLSHGPPSSENNFQMSSSTVTTNFNSNNSSRPSSSVINHIDNSRDASTSIKIILKT